MSVLLNVVDGGFIVVSILSIVSPLVVIYIVVMYSPSNMRGYTRFIINFTMWDFIFSFVLGVLVKPEPIFPFTGAYINGLLFYAGGIGGNISIVLLTIAAGHALLAQCNCLAYRFAVLYSKEFLAYVLSWRTWAKTFLISVVLTVGAEIFVARIQVAPSLISGIINRSSIDFPLAEIPSPKDAVLLYVDIHGSMTMITVSIATFGFLVAEIVSIGFVTFILRQLQAKKENFSKRTYRLHRQLTVALGFQLLTPILFMALPFFTIVIVLYNNSYSPKLLGRFIVISFELYGLVNSTITIYFIKPYRSMVIYKIRGWLRLKRHDIIEKRLSVTPIHPIESLLM